MIKSSKSTKRVFKLTRIKSSQPKGWLRRYTNLAALIHLLQDKKITLLNPASWDDRNDAYFMSEFKRIIDAKSVLAICFAESPETYHHWRVFSNGADGVCIEFDKDSLTRMFDEYEGIRQRNMKYRLISTLMRTPTIGVEELPFLKRKPYEPENEYRVVYVDEAEACEFMDFPISLSWIRQITLSPWMSPALSRAVVKTLKSIDDCAELRIFQSTLIGNDEWKSVTARVRKDG